MKNCEVCGKPCEGTVHIYHARLGVFVHTTCPMTNVRGEDITMHTVYIYNAVALQEVFVEVSKQVTDALVVIGKAVTQAFRAMQKTFRSIHAQVLLGNRIMYGGNGSDARRFPDEWKSTICGAWLCYGAIRPEDKCPSDQYNLKCTCTCHKEK